MKPVIGVMPLFDEEKDSIWMVPGYMEGIRRAGGIPLMVPLWCEGEDLEQINDICAGFLFTGGQDVDPHLYGEEPDALCGRRSVYLTWPGRRTRRYSASAGGFRS